MGDVPFYLKFAPLKNTDFDQYLLITYEPYELAKNVQLSWIQSRPHAFQWAIDELYTLQRYT